MANVPAPQQDNTTNNPVTLFQTELDKYKGDIKVYLPKEITVEAFMRVTMTAITDNPSLLSANRPSLIKACKDCAKAGLLPDGKEAVLAVYNTNVAKKGEQPKWEKIVAFQPMVGGYKKRIWEKGNFTYFSAHAVYANDEFDYCLGDNEYIKHKPAMENRGELIAAYAIVKNKDGQYMRSVLTKEAIEKYREKSPQKNGPFWTGFYDQMAIKTAVRVLAKDLDLSVDFKEEDEYNEIKSEPMPMITNQNETPKLPSPQTEIEPDSTQPEQPQQPEEKPKQTAKKNSPF